ncbi:glycosyltransferase [Jeotgalibacillus soli]|uniref:Uncharacterized protein n=1 Tax=Jeotgalibacillus soli TaxID=889306 RepID=A0A0C2VZX5_9BACL|nr:glycosyltransferase [Jeotgalibacillus soli]KIL49926.1 hypothetical protein KP78_13940 [Jeotgalibacillus soli]
MKILHINTNDLRGGAAKVMMRLVEQQIDLGHDCRVLVGNKESDNLVVAPFDTKRNKHTMKRSVEEGYVDYDTLGAFFLSENPLVQEADVIHLHNAHGNYLHPYALSALSHIKPIVWSLHDMQSITGHCSYSYDCEKWRFGCGDCPDLNEYPSIQVDRTALNWIEKQDVYEHSHFYIVPVAEWIGNMASAGLLKDLPFEVILNGVDIDIYRPMDKQSMRRKYGIPTDRVIIGAVANGGTFGQERKGGSYVQAVVDRLVKSGYNVLLVNVGGEKKGFDGDHLYHVGYLSTEEEMAEVYNTFDLYLFPSIADTCPLVISEAMACGVPIVTFATGGIPELVQHGKNGFVAPYKDVEELYKYSEQLVKDRELRHTFATEARDYCVKYFDHRLVTEKYLKVYEKAIRHFEAKKEEVLVFDLNFVPDVVKQRPEFLHAEHMKKDGVKKSSIKRNFAVLHSGYEDIDDVDAVFLYRQGFEYSDDFIETMLYKGINTDVLTSKTVLKRKNGKAFFKPISAIETDGLNTAFGSNFYSSAFFKENKKSILSGDVIRCSSEQYSTESVGVLIDDYLRLKFSGSVYVYGAGTHTIELLEESVYLRERAIKIIDQNPSLIGTKLLEHYEIVSLEDIHSAVPILISSASFEEEIYEQLCQTVLNPLIKIYN